MRAAPWEPRDSGSFVGGTRRKTQSVGPAEKKTEVKVLE